MFLMPVLRLAVVMTGAETGSLDAEAQSVAGHFCGFKGK